MIMPVRFKLGAFVLGVVALLLGTASVRANGNFLTGAGFIKGANLPWIDGNYYNDLATNPHHPDWGSAYSSADMNGCLSNLNQMGVTVVRFWVNTDDQGCLLNGNGYVTGVTNQMWRNLDNLVALAGSNHLSLYLTLSEGRFDWLTNAAMANAYKTNCLVPLILRYRGNTNIFGIDLMNELDAWIVDPTMGNPWISSGATWAQAQYYITNFATAVHANDPSRLVSCSHVYHGWSNLSSWKGLGLDFYDFHYYSDTIALPPVASLGMDKPVFVGECGQDNADTTWSDALQNTCELAALNSGFSGGYAGVSIWSYSLPDWQTTDYMQYAMLNTNGTWRQVCYTIQSWSAAAAPLIVSFSPTNGAAGTTVTITGTNFAGATAVAFSGVPAAFANNSATQITATVPAGATTGVITVTTPGGTAGSLRNFTIPPVPTNLPVYMDSLLNGFADWSWATVNFLNTSPVHAGSDSISVVANQWQALWTYHNPFSTAPYASLNFWIAGGPSGASGVQVVGVVNRAEQAAFTLPALAANTWIQFNVPLTALGVANLTNCEGFWFYATASGTTTFSVDSIQLNVSQAPVLTPVTAKPAAGWFALQLSGYSGQSYWIQTSTNLINWITLSTNTLTNATLVVSNSVITPARRQFWRAVWP